MSLVGLLVLVFVGVLIYYLLTLLPLPPRIKQVVIAIFIIIAIIYLLSALGVVSGLRL